MFEGRGIYGLGFVLFGGLFVLLLIEVITLPGASLIIPPGGSLEIKVAVIKRRSSSCWKPNVRFELFLRLAMRAPFFVY